jgi:hypothetical protein
MRDIYDIKKRQTLSETSALLWTADQISDKITENIAAGSGLTYT